jgi:hypothetical protein
MSATTPGSAGQTTTRQGTIGFRPDLFGSRAVGSGGGQRWCRQQGCCRQASKDGFTASPAARYPTPKHRKSKRKQYSRQRSVLSRPHAPVADAALVQLALQWPPMAIGKGATMSAGITIRRILITVIAISSIATVTATGATEHVRLALDSGRPSRSAGLIPAWYLISGSDASYWTSTEALALNKKAGLV